MDAGQLHKLARELRSTANRATTDAEDPAATPGELLVAEDIARHDTTTTAEIVRRTGLAQSLVSRTVAKLVAEGFAVTETDSADRRRTKIQTTPDVRTTLRSRGQRNIRQALVEQYPHLTPAVAQGAEALLDELATLLHAPTPNSLTSSPPETLSR